MSLHMIVNINTLYNVFVQPQPPNPLCLHQVYSDHMYKHLQVNF